MASTYTSKPGQQPLKRKVKEQPIGKKVMDTAEELFGHKKSVAKKMKKASF